MKPEGDRRTDLCPPTFHQRVYRRDGRGRRQTNREKSRSRSKNHAEREYAKDTEIKGKEKNIIGESGIRVGEIEREGREWEEDWEREKAERERKKMCRRRSAGKLH